MARPRDILGLNARGKLYLSRNPSKARRLAESKLMIKKLMVENDIPVPSLYASFESMEEVRMFDFDEIKTSFVVKPIGGNAGRGIMIVRRKGKKEIVWLNTSGQVLTRQDVVLHISDILEGQYSTYGEEHRAFIEEWVSTHPKFKKYSYRGTPDIRVIVFNTVPVMAMLRLPTRESMGRANLHQGAIGVGIDMASGVTLFGVHHQRQIKYVPGTKRKLNGIRIPQWTSVLKTAVRAAGVSGLVYGGVDLFVHREKGPMVVEMNVNPGLDVQLANNAGLRQRLERVEGLQIRDEDHGVRVGRALFAEWFADKVKAEDGLVIVDNFETVKIRGMDKKWHDYKAKLDTGAFRTSIDKNIAKDLKLVTKDKVLWYGEFRNSMGVQKRPVVEVTLRLKDKKIRTNASVADRSRSASKVLIGRQDLQGFLVNPIPIQDRG